MKINAQHTKLMKNNEHGAKGQFTAVNVLIKKIKRFHKSNFKAHLKELEQKEANIPTRSRIQKIIKLKAKINKTVTKRMN